MNGPIKTKAFLFPGLVLAALLCAGAPAVAAPAESGQGYAGEPERIPNGNAHLAMEDGEPDGPGAEPADTDEGDGPLDAGSEPPADSAESESEGEEAAGPAPAPAPGAPGEASPHSSAGENPVTAAPATSGEAVTPEPSAPEDTSDEGDALGEDPDAPPATSVPPEAAPSAAEPAPPAPAARRGLPARKQPFTILGQDIPPGTARTVFWEPAQSFEGLALRTPVNILHGRREGPVLCLTAAVHGDELNGVEIVRRVVDSIDPKQLHGVVIGVPIVNLRGFLRSSRYLPDRRDLNRYFPGSTHGSSASRIAHSLFQSIILRCTHLIDLHTGSFHRSNLPQLRANLKNEAVLELTRGFGSMAVLQSGGIPGSLRNAATNAGIPAVTVEAGGPMHLDPEAVATGVAAIETVLDKMHMIERFRLWGDPQPVFYRSLWVRSDHGGILFSHVELGSRVAKGDLLGVVTDPISNARHHILSPVEGRILGMAFNQVVMPGFAAYHVGAVTSENRIRTTEPPAPADAAGTTSEPVEVDPRLEEP